LPRVPLLLTESVGFMMQERVAQSVPLASVPEARDVVFLSKATPGDDELALWLAHRTCDGGRSIGFARSMVTFRPEKCSRDIYWQSVTEFRRLQKRQMTCLNSCGEFSRHAVLANLCDRNPSRDIPYLKSHSEGFHTWSIKEVEQFESAHPVGSKARLALALMLYTSQRRGDAVLFGPDNVQGNWLVFTQQKNKRRKPIHLEIPIRPVLRHILDHSPTGKIAFLTTEFGKPFSPNGFGNWFRKRCDEAGLPPLLCAWTSKGSSTRLNPARPRSKSWPLLATERQRKSHATRVGRNSAS
jgi:hypothetical protein